MALTSRAVLRERLLHALLALGGTASRPEVLDELDRQFGGLLSADDHQPVTSRPYEVKWRNRTSFERADMIRAGLLQDRADGVWALTPGGVSAAETLVGSTDPGGYDWPTVEWVKAPVVVETGLPNGQPISMRHFTDCTHWFRAPDGSWIGDPPRLATNDQMENLPACKDCIREATKHNNPATGMRTSLGSEAEQIPAQGVDLTQSSDAMSMVRRRVEQRFLRRALLDGRDVAPCALCGRTLPAAFLIAAHIVPRHRLTEAERYDFVTAAMLACSLGCDALFEAGFLAVDESGRVAAHRPTTSEALSAAIRAVVGRQVAGTSDRTADNFERHRLLHS